MLCGPNWNTFYLSQVIGDQQVGLQLDQQWYIMYIVSHDKPGYNVKLWHSHFNNKNCHYYYHMNLCLLVLAESFECHNDAKY